MPGRPQPPPYPIEPGDMYINNRSSETLDEPDPPYPHTPPLGKSNTFEVSQSVYTLFPLQVIRGFSLAVTGTYRALQNDRLFNAKHYQQAFMALIAGLALYIVTWLPAYIVTSLVYITTIVSNNSRNHLRHRRINSYVHFINHYVVGIPFLMNTVLRKYDPQPFDDMFMDSLKHTDRMYMEIHKDDDPTKLRPLYHDTLKLYSVNRKTGVEGLVSHFKRNIRRSVFGLVVYILSMIPFLGKLVLPLSGIYTLHQTFGMVNAALFAVIMLAMPNSHWQIVFFHALLSSRSLMGQLLEPYFSRIQFEPKERRKWFREREGVLFGFSLCFYFFIRIPMVGVLGYGIAEAATAFLVTKLTDAPPSPAYAEGFAKSQVLWKSKDEVLKSSIKPVQRQDYNYNFIDKSK